MNNWVIAGGGGTVGNKAAPGPGDTLTFTPGQVVMGSTGTDNPSTDDIANLSIAALTMSSGYSKTITLNQNLTITGANSALQGGTLTGSAVTLNAGATAIINTGANGFTLNNITLNDAGTVNWNNGSLHSNNATINVTGTFNASADNKLDYTTAAGSINITGTTGAFVSNGAGGLRRTEIDIPFNVSSTANPAVKVNTGNLELDGGGTSSGQYNVQGTANLQFTAPVGASATYNWNNGTSFTGAGTTAVLAYATVVIPNTVTVTASNFAQSGGTIQGAGTLSISQSLNWSDGTVGGDPNTTITLSVPAGVTANLSGIPVLDHATFAISGTVNLQNGTFNVNNGATINNSGIFAILDNSSITQFAGPAHSQFNNSGTLRKSGGLGTSTIGVDYTHNRGAILDLRSGRFKFSGSKVGVLDGTFGTGSYQVEVTGTFEQDGGSVQVGLGGTLTADNGFTQTGGDLSVSGMTSMSVTGAFQESGGTTEVGMSATLSVTGAVTLSGGVLTLQGTLSAGSGLQIQSGGTLSATGQANITGNVSNSGTLTLGSSSMAGTLSVSGNYTQSSGATLNALLASSSGSSSQLQVSGLATLAGTFNATLGGAVLPPETFTVLTYGSRSGTFGTLNLPPLSMGSWDPVYDDLQGTFTLNVTW